MMIIHHETRFNEPTKKGPALQTLSPKFYEGVRMDEGSKFVWDQQVVKVDGDRPQTWSFHTQNLIRSFLSSRFGGNLIF